ncbi:MAG: hypothetical protein RO257_12435 [Candidatus Kapabacteria bacterium]|nr:hypothetical protein [Candidatus Kapabacteria bacterium]
MQLLKISIIFIILFYFNNEIYAQFGSSSEDEDIGIYIGLQGGYATYDIKSIIDARNKSILSLPFNAKITDDYPENPYFHGEILLLLHDFELGASLSLISTGTRVYYADYSGEYKFDNVISNFEYGIIIKTPGASETQPFKVQLSGEIGVSSVDIKSTEYLRVFNDSESNSDIFNNKILFFEFGVKLNYYFEGIIASVGASYVVEPQKELTISFEGLRGHLTLGYKLQHIF